jgi:hypothetical protein
MNVNFFNPYSADTSSSTSTSEREVYSSPNTQVTITSRSSEPVFYTTTPTVNTTTTSSSWLGPAMYTAESTTSTNYTNWQRKPPQPQLKTSPPAHQCPSEVVCPSECHGPVTASILNSSSAPVDLPATDEQPGMITVQGESGYFVNRQDVVSWQCGPLPLDQYPINQDPDPQVITKRVEQPVHYTQEVAIRYLRPSTPPAPGDVVIRHERPVVPPPAPPLVIRQQAPRPATPPPMVFRELPPTPPRLIPQKVITISAKQVPPPPRKVIHYDFFFAIAHPH